MRAALAVLLLALVPARALAQPRPPPGPRREPPPSMPSFTMPSRHPQAEEARTLTRRVAARLAVLLEHHEAVWPPAERDPALAAAIELHAAGRLDEAADSFDLALARGARRPAEVGDPAAFISAHIARAAIALARGEVELADATLARAIRYDPTLDLEAAEDSPTLRAALDRVRKRVGQAPGLEIADLGEECASSMVVSRLAGGEVEIGRYDGCKLVATVTARLATDAAEIARTLAGDDIVVRPQVVPAAGAEGAVAPAPRPFYRRAWFWIAVGGVAAASAGTLYWLGRDDGGDTLDVMTHF